MKWWQRLSTNGKVAVGVGGAAVLYLGYRWYKNRQAAAAQNAGASTMTVQSETPQSAGQAQPISVTLPNGTSYSGPGYGLGQVLGMGAPTPTAPNTAPSTPASPAPAVAPTGEQLIGSGYGYSPFTYQGQQYSYVSTPQQALAIQAAGGQLGFQPEPGVFLASPYGGGATVPGTPTYYAATVG